MNVFTAQDFLSAFFSALKLRNINVVSSDELYSFIDGNQEQYQELFIDIDIVNNSGTIYSDDLEEGLSMLQVIGAIGKANPKYERIILKMHKKSASEILETIDEGHRVYIDSLAEAFLAETR